MQFLLLMAYPMIGLTQKGFRFTREGDVDGSVTWALSYCGMTFKNKGSSTTYSALYRAYADILAMSESEDFMEALRSMYSLQSHRHC